jgi:hypothetical protein
VNVADVNSIDSFVSKRNMGEFSVVIMKRFRLNWFEKTKGRHVTYNSRQFSRRLDLEHSQVESMWFELKTKLSPILININYRSEIESHINYWQLFESMIVKGLDTFNLRVFQVKPT